MVLPRKGCRASPPAFFFPKLIVVFYWCQGSQNDRDEKSSGDSDRPLEGIFSPSHQNHCCKLHQYKVSCFFHILTTGNEKKEVDREPGNLSLSAYLPLGRYMSLGKSYNFLDLFLTN